MQVSKKWALLILLTIIQFAVIIVWGLALLSPSTPSWQEISAPEFVVYALIPCLALIIGDVCAFFIIYPSAWTAFRAQFGRA